MSDDDLKLVQIIKRALHVGECEGLISEEEANYVLLNLENKHGAGKCVSVEKILNFIRDRKSEIANQYYDYEDEPLREEYLAALTFIENELEKELGIEERGGEED